MATQYEIRECWRCFEGRVYEAVDPTERPRLAPCTACSGSGHVSVYLLPEASAAAEAVLMAALFALGIVVATPAALALLEEHGMDPGELLARHVSGDWGDLCAEDRRTNDRDLREGGRLFGACDTPAGRVWIITEADRSVTTILLPHEY